MFFLAVRKDNDILADSGEWDRYLNLTATLTDTDFTKPYDQRNLRKTHKLRRCQEDNFVFDEA